MIKPTFIKSSKYIANNLEDGAYVVKDADGDNQAYNFIARISHITETHIAEIWEIDGENAFFLRDSRGFQYAVTKEEFVDFLKENYPADLEWLIWHPEIWEGKYDE